VTPLEMDRLDAYCTAREQAMDAAEERGLTSIDGRALLGVHELRGLVDAARDVEQLRSALQGIRDVRDNHDAHGCETCCLHDADVSLILEASHVDP